MKLWSGIAFALAAGMLWGMVFVAPVMLPEYPAALQSFGRYLAFGLIAAPLGWLDRAELAHLRRADWIEALKLAAVGNLLYYLCLASAIQRAGAPLPTMVIGTLPVFITICANILNQARDGRLPWARLAPSLGLIAAGLACVNQTELAALARDPLADYPRYASGALLAFCAVACWTWYPLRNANWLRAHPQRKPRAWATAQGLATLPLALVGYGLLWAWLGVNHDPLPMPLGPRPWAFIAWMLAIGLFASWLGTLCWNEASQRLPTAIAGQLIVFETLAALGYAFALRGAWPAPLTITGISLLIVGTLWTVHSARSRPAPQTEVAPLAPLAPIEPDTPAARRNGRS